MCNIIVDDEVTVFGNGRNFYGVVTNTIDCPKDHVMIRVIFENSTRVYTFKKHEFTLYQNPAVSQLTKI